MGQKLCRAHHDFFTTDTSKKTGFKLKYFFSCLSQFKTLFTSMNGIHWANNLRGISAAIAHSFSQIRWCVLAVTWTLCANSVIEKEGVRQRKRERERPPQALLLLASPGIFSVKLFADSLWSWIPGPAAGDWCPPSSSTLIYVLNTPGSWTRDRGWGVEGNKIKNNTVWHEYRLASVHWWKHYTIFN